MKHIVALTLLILIGFLGCKFDSKISPANQDLLTQGKSITSATFIALSTELQKAMKRGGVAEAVSYCNLQALPITESLSQKYGVEIKRISDKNRNPKNAPSPYEAATIRTYKEELKSLKQLQPLLVTKGNKTEYYAPIIASALCLKCHGNKEEIKDYEVISDLYPNDLATGYSVGDLRGIWNVTFLEKGK